MQLDKYSLFLHLYSHRRGISLNYIKAIHQVIELRRKRSEFECIPSMVLCSSILRVSSIMKRNKKLYFKHDGVMVIVKVIY